MLYFTLRSNWIILSRFTRGKQAFESEIIILYLILYLLFNAIGSSAISEVYLIRWKINRFVISQILFVCFLSKKYYKIAQCSILLSFK